MENGLPIHTFRLMHFLKTLIHYKEQGFAISEQEYEDEINKDVIVPADRLKNILNDGKLEVPDNPIVPFVKGAGIYPRRKIPCSYFPLFQIMGRHDQPLLIYQTQIDHGNMANAFAGIRLVHPRPGHAPTNPR
jgi:hypothetical protein